MKKQSLAMRIAGRKGSEKMKRARTFRCGVKTVITCGLMLAGLLLASVLLASSAFPKDKKGLPDDAYGATNPSYRVSDCPCMQLPEDMRNWPPAVPPEPREPVKEVENPLATEIYNIATGEVMVVPSIGLIPRRIEPGPISVPPYQGLLPPGILPETVLGADDRVRVSPTTSYPWRTVCKLFMTAADGTHWVCSGAIIGCQDGHGYHILTAGHCIYMHDHGGWISSIEVVPGLDYTYMPYHHAWGTYLRTYTGWTSSADHRHDWAMVTLDRNVGDYTGWMGRITTTNLDWYEGIFNSAGYPADRNCGVSNSWGLCMYFDADYGRVATEYNHWYYMDTYGGQSGMPVWHYDGTNRYIATIHAYGDDGSGSNHGTRLNQDKFDRVITWCGSDTPPTDYADLVDDGQAYSGFSPTSVCAGQTSFHAWCDVRNIGTASSGGFYVTYYASTNTTITPSDYPIGSDYVSSISPFNYRDSDWSSTFPSAIPPGSYYVGWIIDSGNNVTEFDEGNNVAYEPSPKLVVKNPPVCSVSPTSLDFGTVCVGGSKNKTFTITNTGDCTLTGLVTETCSHYSIVSGAGSYSLGAGQSRTVTVKFQPTSSGTKNCTIQTGASCTNVSCTGVGVARVCKVSPTSLDFGNVCVGSYKDNTFTITNTGSCTLAGTISESCAHYSIVSGGGAYILNPGISRKVTVRFQPTSAGTKTCTIETGDAACADVSCTGGGVAPLCDVSPTGLNFDTVCVGQYKDTTFTIENIGSCTLSGTVSEACPDYSIVGSATYSLGTGQSKTFTVRFQPTSTGTIACIIETGNNLCSDVKCKGIGGRPTVCQVSPTSLDFDKVCLGDSSHKTFTITNTGGCTLSGTVSESCPDYYIGTPPDYSLGSGKSKTFTIWFKPLSAGTKNCTIETGSSLCKDVSCTGTGDPCMQCQVSPTSLDFGTVNVGNYLDKTFDISNTGGGTLSGTVSETCGDYSLVGDVTYSLTGGQSKTFTVRFAPASAGVKNCTVETGNAACVDVSCTGIGHVDTCENPVHFVFTDSTGDSYSIVIDSAFLDGLELEECDEIGVFDDTGGGKGLLCVGASVYHPGSLPIPMVAWEDDPLTPQKDGYTAGDTMYFRVWSKNQDREECASSHYSVGDGHFKSGFFSQLWLEAPCGCPTIPLHSGWQWISTNVNPSPCEMESIFVNCWGDLDIVIACDGSFCIPGVGCWIDCWNVCEMYKLHMSDECIIEVCGSKVPTDKPCPLPGGWNCIAYFPECPLEPETALVSIWDNLDIVQNSAGEFCIPGVGCWIECMEYNEGYKVHLSSADILIYPTSCPPCPPPFATTDSHHEFVKSTHFDYKGRTGESYSIVVNSIRVNGELPEVGDEIGVFTASGLCVGAGVWQDEVLGIAVWQDDDRTGQVDGYQSREQMVFRFWDKSEDKEIELSANYTKGDGLFAGGSFASVELSGDTDVGISLQKLEVKQNYPNPFNPATTISFHLPKSCKVTLKIYNLLGQEVRALADHTMEAGTHDISWDGTDNSGNPVASGVYFYRLNAGESNIVRKMIFMR